MAAAEARATGPLTPAGPMAAAPPTSGPRQPSLVPFLLLAVLALAFRLYDVGTPLIDGHSWRQVTNADIARHFAESTWNLFTPQVSWGGLNGVVGMEFPLLHYLIGLTWRVVGESALTARLIPVAFSVASVGLIYLLGRDLFSEGAGRGAAFLLAVAPSTVFFGRSVLSDTPMVTFSIAAVLLWHRALAAPSTRRHTILATACTALAGLVKIPAVIVGVPIAALAWVHRGPATFRDRSLWLGGIVSVALIAGWYWYADYIALRTGLTQAIFRPSGRYGLEVGLGPAAYDTVSHWSTFARLADPDFFRVMLDRFWELHLTAFGFAGAMLGWWLARGMRFALVADAWLAAGVVLLVATAEGQFWHQFHQLPLIPPLALYFGIAAAPLFDGRLLRGSRVRAAGIAACLVMASVMTFRSSGVLVDLYREDNLQAQFPGVAAEVRSLTQEDALLITVDYEDGGTNSPMLLYFAHRQGWSFDVHAVDEIAIDRLRQAFGARYFVTMEWSALGRIKPDVVRYLANFKQVRLATASSQVRMFDLTQPATDR